MSYIGNQPPDTPIVVTREYTFNVTTNTDDFTLPDEYAYTTGAGALEIFKNRLKQEITVDFIEQGALGFHMNVTCVNGDVVIARISNTFLSTQSAESSIYQGYGNGGYPRSVAVTLSDTISVKSYGPNVGTGGDDSVAIRAAEAVAFATGATLEFPNNGGNIYWINGTFTIRCSIKGNGATLKQFSTTASTTPLLLVSVAGLTVEGLTVDGNLYSSGVKVIGSNANLLGVTAKNCRFAGFDLFEVSNTLLRGCVANNIRYQTGSNAAEGFLMQGATGARFEHCLAEDFRRIGFLSTFSGTTMSSNIVLNDCIARNANNCDDSVAEYNAGFWSEYTNGITFNNCLAEDIAGNAGQISGRVYGMVPSGIGGTAHSKVIVNNCKIGDTSGTLPIGIVVTGTNQYPDVTISNTTIEKYAVGIRVQGSTDTVTVRDCTGIGGIHDAAAEGFLILNGPGGANNKVSLVGLSEKNPTYSSADAAGLYLENGFSLGSREVVVENCQDLYMIQRSPSLIVRISNSFIIKRSENYDTIQANQIFIDNCTFWNQASTFNWLLAVASNDQSRAQISNCKFENMTFETGSQNAMLMINDCEFKASVIRWKGVGEVRSMLKITGCLFNDVPSGGSIIGSLSAGTKDTVHVSMCSFIAASSANTPIRSSAVAPDYVLLHMNAYSTTSLATMSGATVNSAVANIQTV